MHRSAHDVRAVEREIAEVIRILENPALTKEAIMSALDRLTAVNATLAKVPEGIAEAEAAAAANADAALDDQLTTLESNVAALPQPAATQSESETPQQIA